MLARGDSVGVFQFESEGMQSALRQVKPTEFDDLVALVALYRPGAMDQIPTYARGKRNPELVSVPDERLEPMIGGTYGVILYQEQAMQISKALAGFSAPRRTTCARRSARRTARRWPRSSRSSSPAARPRARTRR
jgi:DNA polymerase-3 subunit alpha